MYQPHFHSGTEKARALPQACMEESGFVFVVSSFLINQLMHIFRGPGITSRLWL